MSKRDQYARAARGWTRSAYADPGGYLDHRAATVVALGTRLDPGDTVLDLACGDGGLAPHLLSRGMRYHGVDVTPEMVAAAADALGDRAAFEVGDLRTYVPAEPVSATTCFRAIYYAGDLPTFFRRVREYTTKKLVFDVSPRRYDVDDLAATLRAAGFARVELRPFFRPQRFALPPAIAAVVPIVESSGPLARFLLRYRFTYVVAASCE